MFSVLRKKLGTISLRLTLWHAFLFLVAAMAVLSVTYVLIDQRLESQERDVIELRLNQYASEYERGGIDAVRSLASLRKGREQKAFFVRLADSRNRTLFLRDAEDWAEFDLASLSEKAPSTAEPRSWIALDSPLGTKLLLGTAWLSDGSLLEVGRTTESLQELLKGFRTAALVVLLIFVPASIIGGAFLAAQILKPLHHLTEAARHIVATGRFDARVASRGNGDELDALVHLFNEMLEHIERLLQAMRDSLDNVAHDLRTPITHIRQKAQAALESNKDVEVVREALADCIEETERVTTLLNTLMDISEAESGATRFERLPVSISAVVDTVIDSYLEVAEEKQVSVTTSINANWQVLGDAGALRRVFANLLDNAIKYTPSGGKIDFTATPENGFLAISVADNGQGISPQDLPRIYDRLFRGDKSRSERGLGLGLSFVRAIVISHGGSIDIQGAVNQGTLATVRLPMPPAEQPDEAR